MTDHPNDTTIEVDERLPLVRIVREFDAPPAKMFRAHVDPDLVVQWLGPRRVDMKVDRWDCRTGGEYRYLHVSDGTDHWFHGSFHEVEPDSRIVQTFTYEGWPGNVALETMLFEDLGDGRTRLVAESLVDSFESRDALLELLRIIVHGSSSSWVWFDSESSALPVVKLSRLWVGL